MERECAVWYRPCGGLTFDALVVRVQKELGGRGHKTERSLALCLIGLFALYPRRGDGAVASFNRIVGTIGDCDVSQFFVTPVRCAGKIQSFSMGRFVVGPADLSRIEHRSKKAGSADLFARWRHELDDRFTLERGVVPCRSLGIATLRDDVLKSISGDAERERFWKRCVTAYFQALAVAYAQDFWEELLESQHLLIAAGAPYLNDRVTRMLIHSQMVSIFRNVEGEGFVAPVGQDSIVMERDGRARSPHAKR
jgi:hypothetical protein